MKLGEIKVGYLGGKRRKSMRVEIETYSPKDMMTKQTFGNVRMDRNEDYRETLARFFDVEEDEDGNVSIYNVLTDETVIFLKKQ